MDLTKLRDFENILQQNANWYAIQRDLLNKEIVKINKLSDNGDINYGKIEELEKRKTYLDNKAAYELKELAKFQENKNKFLINNLRHSITGQSK